MATQTKKTPEKPKPRPRSLKDRARKARDAFRDALGGGRFTCTCCPGKVFRGHKALNAHHLARHGGYWAGDKARKTGRKIGKATDAARKHARGWREAHGYADQYGNATAKSRARPELRGRVKVKDLRTAHRHSRSHDRTHRRAEKHEQRADKAKAKGLPERADIHRGRAADTRNRHEQAWPQRKPAARTTPAPTGRTRT